MHHSVFERGCVQCKIIWEGMGVDILLLYVCVIECKTKLSNCDNPFSGLSKDYLKYYNVDQQRSEVLFPTIEYS